MKILFNHFSSLEFSSAKRENLKSYCDIVCLNSLAFFVLFCQATFWGVFEQVIWEWWSKQDFDSIWASATSVSLLSNQFSKQLGFYQISSLLTAIKRGYYCKNFYEAITTKEELFIGMRPYADSCNINLPVYHLSYPYHRVWKSLKKSHFLRGCSIESSPYDFFIVPFSD